MAFLYYFLGSVVLGIIPAIIARQAKRNFFLWWIYGAIFLPAALLHSILLVLKIQKGMIAVYVLAVVYGIGIFYFATWFLSTQPVSIQQANIVETKLKIANIMLNESDSLRPEQVPDFKAYIEEKTGATRADIDLSLEYFEDRLLTDKEKLQEFALGLLASIEKQYIYISEKGAFEEFSVPMGSAARVFRTYIDSLAILNKYTGSDVSTLESNYKSMLTTEEMYFKTTVTADEFLAHLDKEAAKNNQKDRILTLIDHYIATGQLLIDNNKKPLAASCFDSAIALFSKVLQIPAMDQKERAGFYYKTAEVQDMKNDAEAIIATYSSYLDIVFRARLYTDRDIIEEVPKFIKLPAIKRNHETIVKALQVFLSISGTSKASAVKDISNMENLVLIEIFPYLNGSERNKYAKEIDANYKVMISSNTIDTLPTIHKAFTFFEDIRHPDLGAFYMETAKTLFQELLDTEKKVIEEYTVLGEKVAEVDARVLEVMEMTTPLSKAQKAELLNARTTILDKTAKIEAINTIVKEGRSIIASMIDPKASQDETFRIESTVKDSVRQLGENFALIEEQLK